MSHEINTRFAESSQEARAEDHQCIKGCAKVWGQCWTDEELDQFTKEQQLNKAHPANS